VETRDAPDIWDAFIRWCRRNKRQARRLAGPTEAQLAEYDQWMDRWIAQAEAARDQETANAEA
jgi:hypothetical protein